MRSIKVSTTDNRVRVVPVDDLLVRGSGLCAASLVPPRNLVDEFFVSGACAWDRWREAAWKPFEISTAEYEKLAAKLRKDRGFKRKKNYSEGVSKEDWQSVQVSALSGHSIQKVRKVLARISLIDKLLEIARDEPERDIIEFLTVARFEASERIR